MPFLKRDSQSHHALDGELQEFLDLLNRVKQNGTCASKALSILEGEHGSKLLYSNWKKSWEINKWIAHGKFAGLGGTRDEMVDALFSVFEKMIFFVMPVDSPYLKKKYKWHLQDALSEYLSLRGVDVPLPERDILSAIDPIVPAVPTSSDSEKTDIETQAVDDKNDITDDNQKKTKIKRNLSKAGRGCIERYNEEVKTDPSITMKHAVEEYVKEHGGKVSSLIRQINDHPEEWKVQGKDDTKTTN